MTGPLSDADRARIRAEEEERLRVRAELSAPAPVARVSVPFSDADRARIRAKEMERELYRDEFAVVTNIRFMTNGETHALSGITSVSKYLQDPSRVTEIICVLVGIGALYFKTLETTVLGILLILVAVAVWLTKKPKHIVAIRTAAGEIRVITDQNAERVNKIINALNQAIVSRG